MTSQVVTRPPCPAKARQDTTNATDGIFSNGRDQLLLTPYGDACGYTPGFDIGLALSNAQTGQPDRMGNGGAPRPGATP